MESQLAVIEGPLETIVMVSPAGRSRGVNWSAISQSWAIISAVRSMILV